MNKDKEIKFVGQPVFGQLLKYIDKSAFIQLVKAKKTDYYYKAFKSWDHTVVMLFGILSRCDSMSEICEGLRAFGGKLNHLGLQKAPAKSTAGDGLRNRDNSFFEELYYQLADRYKNFLSDSRTYGLTFKELLIIDSTTIRLFSDILKGVGRNPKNDGKKKGGLKVHMLIDAVQSVAKYVRITAAKLHDKNFLSQITVPAHSMLVFDRAYNYYKQFAKWTAEKIYFVTRQKKNAVCEILEKIIDKVLLNGEFGVYKEEVIEVRYNENKEEKKLKLRRVYYCDQKNRHFVFITNNFDITAEEVALIYKKRWQIELLFKKMKQNFQLHYFYGENENAIRTQIWCTLIAQLLLTVLQKMANVKKAFSTVATLVRIHLISLLDISQLLRNVKRTYTKKNTG
ncbi:MAG: IS4 family transposase, partial [Melioribacteraceae bacterium]|nr:IS4 family transposase [Melioribacteraceae bacterium]